MKGLFIGLTVIDHLYFLSFFPPENSKNNTSRFLRDVGGPASNAAITFAALGGEATLVSGIGNNVDKSWIIEKLNQFDVQHIDLFSHQETEAIISSVIVNTTNGSRTVFTAKPAAGIKTSYPVEDLLRSDFDVICVDGFFSDFLVNYFSKSSTKIPTILDGGSWKTNSDQILDHTTYPILSEQFKIPYDIDIQDYFGQKGIEKYAITRGESPIIGHDGIREFEIKVPAIAAIDTLGAGDIFHGAFAYFVIRHQHNFKKALMESARIASFSCQFYGSKTWIEPYQDSLD